MLIKRRKTREVEAHLSQKEITLIVGARQTGKTTLMKELQQNLLQQGKKTVFFNLDFESDRPFFDSQALFVKKLELEFGKEKGTVFIDEIQRKENAGLFLKGLYDMDLGYKYVVSGSGSLELKEKIHESLMGRKRMFEMTPVTFDEFVNFTTDYRYENRLSELFSLEPDTLNLLLEEYLNFGGYPRVVLEKKSDEKEKIINEIYRSYLEKDITYLLKVEKTEAFNSLIKIMADQTGKLLNYSELAGTLGISAATVKHYLYLAEKTFTIQRVTPWFQNIRKEISKAPHVYFHDIGLRNYALGLFGNVNREQDRGFLFENLVWQIIREKLEFGSRSLHFWRSKDGAEVDFVVVSGKEVLPVEVKYGSLKEPRVEKSMRSFIEKYAPPRALVVTKEFRAKMKIQQTHLDFLPFYDLYSLDQSIKILDRLLKKL